MSDVDTPSASCPIIASGVIGACSRRGWIRAATSLSMALSRSGFLPATGAIALSGGTARAAANSSATRTALVIGNAAYAVAPLRNPLNDARLISKTLRQLSFKVDHLEDAKLPEMLNSIRDWLAASRDAESRFFYFAGHGAQLRGRNFLLPVDAEIQSEEDLHQSAVNATELAERLSRIPSGVNLVVLDACRNMPYPLTAAAQGSRSRSTIGSVATGLVTAMSPQGTLIAFATAPGSIALDGKDSQSSAYTRHLAAQMAVPGVPVETVFKRVRAAVAKETGNRQVPWETSSLMGDYCLQPGAGGQCNVAFGSAGAIDLGKLR